MSSASTTTTHDIADIHALRERFHRDGYLVLGGILDADRLAAIDAAIDRFQAAPVTGPGRFAALVAMPEVRALVAEEPVLRVLVALMSADLTASCLHLNVIEPGTIDGAASWHQDGPRPFTPHVDGVSPVLQIKAGFIISDQSQPGRGNTRVIPGSHRRPCTEFHDSRRERLCEGPEVSVQMPGELQVTGAPGDVFLFAQSMWHAGSRNLSEFQRRTVFVGYRYRWMHQGDQFHALSRDPAIWNTLSPFARQLFAGDYRDEQGQRKCEAMPLAELLPVAPVEVR